MSLVVQDLTVEIGAKTIVDGVSFDVRAGDKVGLVGRNGAGKTTLFRVLGGTTKPVGGSIRRADATGYLSQDPRQDDVPPDTGCLTHVLSGRGLDDIATRLEKLAAVLEENPSDRNLRRYANAQERFEALGGYAAEAEARALVDGLGLRPDRLDLKIGALSGGERRRLELARILFAGSELLLLDEPTNHLDADARDWLLQFLRDYRGAMVVISHDLTLLDDAITRVLHLDRDGEDDVGELRAYRGTYSEYQRARAEEQERLARLAELQDKEISRLTMRANSMRGQTAKRARVAKGLDTRAARLERDRVTVSKQRSGLKVRLPEPPPSDRTVVEAFGLAKRYGDLQVFEKVSFDVGRGERLLVLGLNGAGKTTLLKLLAGTVSRGAGTVTAGPRTSIGYYAQEHEGIQDGRSLLDHMRDAAAMTDTDLRGVMGMFGLSGEKADQDAGTLSGGEKTRLALAQLVAGSHNLLLLDEPTNNLDPGSRTAIGRALSTWPGTMILVSHDVEFVRALQPNRVLTMPEAQLDHFDDEMLELVELA